MNDFPLLTLYTFAPLLAAVVVLCLPNGKASAIKWAALLGSAVSLALGAYACGVFVDTGNVQFREQVPWISTFNIHYRMGMDGLSAPMVLLSGIVGFIAILASWGIEKNVKAYFALLLTLLTGMNGVFCALDFFCFYVFWEVMLLPMYFLIGLWGGPNRVYAATKFFLYTLGGSVLLLVALLGTWYWSDGRGLVYPDENGVKIESEAVDKVKLDLMERSASAWTEISEKKGNRTQILAKYNVDLGFGDEDQRTAQLVTATDLWKKIKDNEKTTSKDLHHQFVQSKLAEFPLSRTFDLMELRARYTLFLGDIKLAGWMPEISFSALMFVFLFIAFAIKVPVFPFHTWLPWAHVEAPTAISVILAGILLKMGVYGLFRISYSLFPTEGVAFAVPIGILGVIGILYGAFCALAQDDMKKLVAYSSVSHMGFCMLGLAALTPWGMTGSLLQMFNHGTSTSMLFILVGVIYDRAHHRDLNKFGGLAKALPVYSFFAIVAVMASAGLPGLSGFVSEILVFLGSFQSNMGPQTGSNVTFQVLTFLATSSVIFTAVYLLWMLQRVFFGPLNERYRHYKDVNAREIASLTPLLVLVVLFGVYPQPLVNMTSRSVEKLQAFVVQSGKVKAELGQIAQDTPQGDAAPKATAENTPAPTAKQNQLAPKPEAAQEPAAPKAETQSEPLAQDKPVHKAEALH